MSICSLDSLVAYIYIRLNQTSAKKNDISAKIEAVKHLQAVFLHTAE